MQQQSQPSVEGGVITFGDLSEPVMESSPRTVQHHAVAPAPTTAVSPAPTPTVAIQPAVAAAPLPTVETPPATTIPPAIQALQRDPAPPIAATPAQNPQVQTAQVPRALRQLESTLVSTPSPNLPLTASGRPARQSHQRPPGYYSKERQGYATSMQDIDRNLKSTETLSEFFACHMMAGECAKRYGKERQEAAGIAEVVNIIGRGGLQPVDASLLSAKELSNVVPSFIFYKAKDPLPTGNEAEDDVPDLAESEVDPSEQPWQEVITKSARKAQRAKAKTVHGKRQQRDAKRDAAATIRARWVGGGNHQHRGPELSDQVAPTARSVSHNIICALAAHEHRPLQTGDVPSAYLQTEYKNAEGRVLYVKADRATAQLIVTAYPDTAGLLRADGTMLLRVDLALYGLVESAWLWYKELVKLLESMEYIISESDKGVAYKHVYEGEKCIGSNFATLHVDDILCAPSNNATGKKLAEEFWSTLEAKWPGIKRQNGPKIRHLSWDIIQDPKTGGVTKSQGSYFADIVADLQITEQQKSPCRLDLFSSRPASPLLDAKRHKDYRSILQRVGFGREGRADIDATVSRLQRFQSAPTELDWSDLRHLLSYLNYATDLPIHFNPYDTQIRMECDAGYNVSDKGDSQGGWIMTLGGSTIASKSFRIKTIVLDSTSAEIVAVTDGICEALWARDLLIELGYAQKSIEIKEDNQSCITMLQKEPRNFQTKSKHVRVKWRFYRQVHRNGLVHLKYCPTEDMRADLLTKPLGGTARCRHMVSILKGQCKTVRFAKTPEPSRSNGRKR